MEINNYYWRFMYKNYISCYAGLCIGKRPQINNNFFIQNKGQWNPEVKFLARIGGMNAWITKVN